MYYTLKCWNCCGLTNVATEYYTTCPNCGSPYYQTTQVMKYTICDIPLEFINIGNVYKKEPSLLTYANNIYHFVKAVENPEVSVIITSQEVYSYDSDLRFMQRVVTVDNPEFEFFSIQNHLVTETDFYGEARPTVIKADQVHNSAIIAQTNVILDEGVTIGPNVTIYENTVIGKNTIVSAGSVIGVEGARLVKRPDGGFLRVRHGGGVRIGDGCFIGANAVVVKSVWRQHTTIGDGCFIGNFANVGHNVVIEDNVQVLPGSILCGRSNMKSYAILSPGSIVRDGVVVAGRASLGAVVTKDVEEGQQVSGNFAIDHSEFLRNLA